VARCLEVEMTSQGESFDEALANPCVALELYFEDQPFPDGVEPSIIAPVDIPGVSPALCPHSGRLAGSLMSGTRRGQHRCHRDRGVRSFLSGAPCRWRCDVKRPVQYPVEITERGQSANPRLQASPSLLMPD